jgi:hypothetical protein
VIFYAFEGRSGCPNAAVVIGEMLNGSVGFAFLVLSLSLPIRAYGKLGPRDRDMDAYSTNAKLVTVGVGASRRLDMISTTMPAAFSGGREARPPCCRETIARVRSPMSRWWVFDA